MKDNGRLANYWNVGTSLIQMACLPSGKKRLREIFAETVAFTQPMSSLFSYGEKGYEFEYSGRNVTYFGLPCHLIETFMQEQYSELDCSDATVVDVGAAEGDTAIYFSINGAKRIIGFEGNRYRAALANLNFENNAVGNVELRAERCSKLPMPSEDKWVAKIDCEGGEYAIIAASELELPHYDQLILEYHNGLQNIPKILEHAGFVWRTTFVQTEDVGLLYAKRNLVLS